MQKIKGMLAPVTMYNLVGEKIEFKPLVVAVVDKEANIMRLAVDKPNDKQCHMYSIPFFSLVYIFDRYTENTLGSMSFVVGCHVIDIKLEILLWIAGEVEEKGEIYEV